ncbi:hypothetical protein HBB16_15355 [Pseudonocardia sp. MCCB 268]|nr:hypothetical protein [Pseudonocardia cytotoxica]
MARTDVDGFTSTSDGDLRIRWPDRCPASRWSSAADGRPRDHLGVRPDLFADGRLVGENSAAAVGH